MDNICKYYAKKNLYRILKECESAGITPEELYHELAVSKIPLVDNTIDMMFTLATKKTDELLT